MSQQGQTYHNEHERDEITLTQLVVNIRDFFWLAVRHWWLFGLLFLVFGGYFGYKAFTEPTTYQAELTFMINEDDGGFPGVAGILGQFGFGARRGRFNLDKVLELSTSRNIVGKMALTEATVDGNEDLIANHLISIYELDEKWSEKVPELEGFMFKRDSLPAFDQLERDALLRVYRKLVGGQKNPGLISNAYSEETTILSITAETLNQDLSMAIVNELYERLSEFYIDKTIERQQATYDIVNAKVDSIVGALRTAEISLARFKDQNKSVFLNVDRLRQSQLEMEIQKLHLVHGKALENMEIADFSLKNATPFIQEIDRPIGPLTPLAPSKIKALLIGAILALVVGCLYLLVKQFLAQLSQSEIGNIE